MVYSTVTLCLVTQKSNMTPAPMNKTMNLKDHSPQLQVEGEL